MSKSTTRALLAGLFSLGCAQLAATTAAAQDVATVFVHGFNSDSTYWLPIAGQLSTLLRISPVTKSTLFYKSDADQASLLSSKLNDDARTNSPVLRLPLVAHSNGGLVSRQLSKTDARLEKLVTVGVPHRGTALANNWLNYSVYNYGAYVVSSMYAPLNYYVNHDPAVPGAVSSTAGPVFNLLGGIFNVIDQVMCPIASLCVGIEVANQIVPVVYDLRAIGSAFIDELNSAVNLSRESSAISKRIGLYTTIDPVNGLFHLLFPGNVNTLATSRMLGIATYLSLWNYYDYHEDYELLAHRQLWLDGAVALYDIDANWYDLIGSLESHTVGFNPQTGQLFGQTVIFANDGLIDHRSAGYPNGTLISLIPGNIAHTEHSGSSAVKSKLESILRTEFGILDRSAPPPPPPSWPVQIHGPMAVRPGNTCYWYASSGISDASYDWRVNGTSLGSAQDFWYSGSSSFTLEVQVWNSAGQGGSSTVSVHVSAGNEQCYVE